ncbi:NADP-dependent oxidoreductase [Streptomyces acidiscabies]|uniref:NADP-dependent oxidoreductase n=1 Tax=Streptomyces acidiscabies TaxID=42234 RepID=A0AAP6BJY3_9ACTN|nr:NADP-dependent oxidoreductase [Streptomyces acidiscabies]MBZ3913984.1 NADP-dependent oxidoreductase [Streptomyces acidiscabies]MDX2965857.1 NADP-dependent oxidoreductase [Streptomyces acidiscabies]MDX3025315.1 NADP-dependent oxidoreductase [Streptomyces acidiscabies]MDX3795693.1 NADP-dependent oxidoreductase [Streptomyces acidiscabies]GAQ57035.1 zinc-type alcohol dehydrogenase-like protein [Streptomyces acidiscabies]
MRAVQIDHHGGPEVLTVREIPDPVPAPGEVLIRTAASSLNPVDWKTRAKDIGPALPATLGWDLSGTVVTANDAPFEPGDQVVAMSAQIATARGTWSELVALPAHLLTHAPTTVPLTDAAALPLAGVTAVQALDKTALTEGARLLVIGAIGAVGGLAVQLARHTGTEVDALVSRPAHLAEAGALGAVHVTHTLTDLTPATYDAILDTAGLDAGHLLAPGGRYVSIADEPLPDVPGATKSYVQENAAHLAHLVALIDKGDLRLRIATRHPLDQVRAAHEEFEAGGVLGKILLTF